METNSDQIEQLKKQIEKLESQIEGNSETKSEIKKEEESPLYDIYSWRAAVYFNKDKNWFTLMSIISVISVILALLFENFMLVFVIIAMGFYIYVLNTIKPITLRNSITNKGIRIENELFLWSDIDYFWISEKDKELLINLELLHLKGRRTILVGKGDLNKILVELTKHEDYREPTGLAAFVSRINTGRYKKLTEINNGLSSTKSL
jgi:hypothetical protein